MSRNRSSRTTSTDNTSIHDARHHPGGAHELGLNLLVDTQVIHRVVGLVCQSHALAGSRAC
jgi:hypothetical protein